MSLFDAIDAVGSGMMAQSVRLNVVASNMANIDTTAASEETAWHAKMPVFKTTRINASQVAKGVEVVAIKESQLPVKRFYQPGHTMADSQGYVYGSNVNRMETLANMISASQSYQADVQLANTCKDLLMRVVAMLKN